MELEEIIKRCKNGEQQAQSLLYKRYSQQMLRICYRFVADKQIAQDLMHDGFIIIFTSINSLQQPEKIEYWMGRIMTNLALKYLNQTHSIPIIPLSDLSEGQEPMNEEPLPDLLPLETLLEMIDKLPEGYRNVFKLSVLDGLSHKEIAELLHIAPHSSSSQFYRAKEFLKKMIIQYYSLLILLLLLLLPVCYLLFWKDTPKVYHLQNNMTTNKPKHSGIEADIKNPTIISLKKHILQKIEITLLSSDTITTHFDEIAKDTTEKLLIIHQPKAEMWTQNNKPKNSLYSSFKHSGWTLSFEYNGGRASTNVLPKSFATPAKEDISSTIIPPYTNNWNDYYHYLQQYGYMQEDQKETQSLISIAQRNNGKIVEKKRHYLPFTIGMLLHKSINDHWGIETGLNYTRLTSDFETGNNAFIYEKQKLHYVGIPLRGTYLLGKIKRFSIYLSAGATLEIPVSATLKTEYVIENNVDYSKQNTLSIPLQWSINGGLGIQYQLTPSIGLFAEPGFHYYFNDGSELKTIRKEHPFNFLLPIGIRFSY